jgi:hypothetical protein
MTEQSSFSISLNPGSGPVAQATEENATHNMAVFILDLGARNLPAIGATRLPDKDYGEGRYAFSVVMADGQTFEVQMPGLPVEQVRWLKSDGQDIWEFPRLYVDDGSWIWYFALDQFMDDDAPRRWPNGTVEGGELIQSHTIRPGSGGAA